MNEFKWLGVHDYLDACAKELGSPLSDEQVIHFKQAYRKKYLAYKKKEHRKNHKTVSISMSKEDYLMLQERAKEGGIKMRDYFFLKLFQKSEQHMVKKSLLPKLLTLIDDVEFAMYAKGTLHLPKTLEVLLQIKNLLL